jgi:hypothetical protein
MRRQIWLAPVFAGGLLLTAGCHSAPRTSQMTVEDYRSIAADIGENLKADLAKGFLADRTPESPRMVIAFQQVLNYTTENMSPGAKWYLMKSVTDSLPKPFLHEKNIVFVMSAEQLREAIKVGTVEPNTGTDRQPTHTFTAKFRSASRMAGKTGRTDYYMCSYEITDLTTGAVAYSSSVEFTRWAKGRSFD